MADEIMSRLLQMIAQTEDELNLRTNFAQTQAMAAHDLDKLWGDTVHTEVAALNARRAESTALDLKVLRTCLELLSTKEMA